MATRWKRWKPAVSAAVFFLGTSLVLSSLLALLSAWLRSASPFQLSELFHAGSVQDTAAYRDAVSNRLDTLLSMGAHYPKPATTYVTVSGDTLALGEDVLPGEDITLSIRRIQDEAASSSALEEWAYWQDMAETLNTSYQDDKNILYSVFYRGRRIYTNAQDLTGWNNVLFSRTTPFERDPDDLPAGYNLLITFTGGTTIMYLDGARCEIYGDGFYRDGDWRVPGYENFTVDELLTDNVAVRMAVRREPLRYLHKSANFLSESPSGELYELTVRLDQDRKLLRNRLILLGAGALLLVLCVLLREGRRQAEEVVAQWTGRLWFEGKILLLLLLLLPLLICLLIGLWEDRWLLVESALEGSLAAGTAAPAFQLLLGALLYRWGPIPQLMAFWGIYLGINDLRQGARPWENSLFSRGQMKYSFQQRAVRRIRLVAALGVLPIGVLLLGALYTRDIRLILAAGTAAGVLLLLWALQAAGERAAARETGLLVDRIQAVRQGDLSGGLALPASSELAQAAAELMDVQQGLKAAVEEQIRSERTKMELITNVSHDLKTPLTSIISYVDLLKKEEGLPLHVQEYVQILEEKSQRLRSMVRDVFEISKAASGELPVALEVLDLAKLLRQTLADMEDPIAEAPITLREDIPDSPAYILADGQRLYRIFQNLLQNALQYSLEGSRVYIALRTENGTALASVRNTSRIELPSGVDFTERFVRGDASRTDGGSGLGLSIARTFTEACGGRFRIETEADLFSAFVEFPLVPLPSSEGCEPLQEATAS